MTNYADPCSLLLWHLVFSDSAMVLKALTLGWHVAIEVLPSGRHCVCVRKEVDMCDQTVTRKYTASSEQSRTLSSVQFHEEILSAPDMYCD